MKVGFIYSQIFRHGGIQRVVATIVNQLSEKHEVFIICNEEIENSKNVYAINLNRVRVVHREIFSEENQGRLFNKYIRKLLGLGSLFFDFNAKKNLSEIVNEFQLDCVVGCSMNYNLLLAMIKSKLQCKVIGWENNSFDSYFNQNVKINLKSKFKTWIISFFLSKLDHFIVLTKNDQKLYQEHLSLKSEVISNPLSFNSNKKSMVNEKQILIIGRLDCTKGTDFLPMIIENVIKFNPDWKFKVIGEGVLDERLKQEIEERNLSHNVEISGFTNSICEEYLSSAIYICTSRFESFGLTVLEAMHCGLPIVTFNTSGPSELIGGQDCGFIITQYEISSFAQAINTLCTDEQLRKQYSKNAIRRASDFEIEKICGLWEEVLNP